MNSKSIDRVIIMLSEFTNSQAGNIYDTIRGMSREEFLEHVADERKTAAAPGSPLNLIYDVPDLSIDDMRALRDGKHAVNVDAMVALWDTDKWAELLRRSIPGVDQDLAEKMAEDISTPDSDTNAIAKGIGMVLPDIPIITFDDELLAGLAQLTAAGFNKIRNYIKNQETMPDTWYEMIRAGRALRELKLRRTMMLRSAVFEQNSFGEEGPNRLAAENGAPMGDVIASYFKGGKEQGAPNPLAGVFEALNAPRLNPWLEHAADHPEEGGLFSGIGRALKKVAGSALKLAPIAASFGGPLGSLGASFGTKALQALARSPNRRDIISGNSVRAVPAIIAELRQLLARHGG